MTQKAFIDALFARAAEEHFDAAEIILDRAESFEVDILGGEIKDYNASTAIGLGFRALQNGKMGVSSTQILDEDAIELLIRGAKENIALIQSEDTPFLYAGDAVYPEVTTFHPALETPTAAEKIAWARELEKSALSADAHITHVAGACIFSESDERTIINTLGLNVVRKCNYLGGYVCAVAEENGQAAEGSAFFSVTDPKDIDIQKTAAEAAEKAMRELRAVKGQGGKTRVVFAPEAARQMMATFCGVFSAKAAQKGLSLFAGKEGQAVAAPCITLRDDPLLENGGASRAFDDEGVAAYTKDIIAEGTLTTLLHNLKTANKQGVKSTANASRSFASDTGIAPSNFYIVPSDRTEESLLAEIDEGIVITGLMGMHSGANAISGDFSLGAKGIAVHGGKKCESIKQITVAGNFFTLLKNIRAVGSDLEFGLPGGTVFGTPSVYAGEMDIAGQ